MSFTDRLEEEDERDDGELYPVFRKQWYVLEDHEHEMVLSCEYPMEVRQ